MIEPYQYNSLKWYDVKQLYCHRYFERSLLCFFKKLIPERDASWVTDQKKEKKKWPLILKRVDIYSHKGNFHSFHVQHSAALFRELLMSLESFKMVYGVLLGHSGKQTSVKCAGACGSTFRPCACA